MNNSKTDHVSKSVVYSSQSKHLRPSNRYLTSLCLPVDDYCLLIAEIPAGAIVPFTATPIAKACISFQEK
jgi:hypothetical protein